MCIICSCKIINTISLVRSRHPPSTLPATRFYESAARLHHHTKCTTWATIQIRGSLMGNRLEVSPFRVRRTKDHWKTSVGSSVHSGGLLIQFRTGLLWGRNADVLFPKTLPERINVNKSAKLFESSSFVDLENSIL